MIAEIIPEKRTGVDKDYFSYLVPERLQKEITVGSIVSIPFGKKQVRGVVSSLLSTIEPHPQYELKEISSIESYFSLPKNYLLLIKEISEYYLCSLGEALSLFLPPGLIKPRKIIRSQVTIDPVIKQLNEAQEKITRSLLKSLDQPTKKPALLFGVTSSGKTEVYLKLAVEVIKRGQQVVVLVPEIMLAPQTLGRFQAVFGDSVAIIHSELSKSERLSGYRDFYSGTKPIIVGPRSALLVPSEKIGLIIVDEVEDASYKQDKNPKYHAVTLAEMIAKKQNAQLLLGSATPSVELYYKTQTGEFQLYELFDRYQGKSLPQTSVVDLRDEIKRSNFSPISELLQEEISKALLGHHQIFLFLNRRGTSTFISCRDCGEVILCPHCAIPLVYHVRENNRYLNCHHCDYQTTVPYQCPVCRGARIKYFGAGVEKIEQEIKKLYPSARIRRVDSQSLSSKGDHEQLYRELKSHEIDILIGTQVIAKGLDIPKVALVGVVSADVGLHLPHYKADERVFQLLTQVSGRSGRGEVAGRTIIQSYWPDSKAILAAKQHDFPSFYQAEIGERQKYENPPFSHLIRVVSEDRDPAKARAALTDIATAASSAGLEVVGPAKAFFARIRNNYRYHLLIKTSKLPDSRLAKIYRTNPYLSWDVDPESLL